MIDHGYYQTKVDFWLEKAITDIKKDYGHDVSVYQKSKNLFKFGRSDVIGTSIGTVALFPAGILYETLLTDNLITHISSSSTSDTSLLSVEGHTIDGNGDFTFVVQAVTLQGQTKTALTTPLARCSRIKNNSSVNLVGTAYAYEDVAVTAGVPGTATAVHCMLDAGKQQSEKAATTISKDDYMIVLGGFVDVLEKTGSPLVSTDFQVKQKGGVFLPTGISASTSNGQGRLVDFKPYLIIPPNSDVRVVATSSASNTTVSAGFFGVLALRVN